MSEGSTIRWWCQQTGRVVEVVGMELDSMEQYKDEASQYLLPPLKTNYHYSHFIFLYCYVKFDFLVRGINEGKSYHLVLRRFRRNVGRLMQFVQFPIHTCIHWSNHVMFSQLMELPISVTNSDSLCSNIFIRSSSIKNCFPCSFAHKYFRIANISF